MEARSQPPEQILGKYHIVKPLKIGGTAAIYLAIMRGENNFSREVVIKRPLPHLIADRRSRLMFIDEAHIAARLSHPNICQVLDLVSREDEVYLVLEYLRGVDVREILKRCIQLGRLVPPEVAVWIAIEMAAGLDCAHEAVGLDGNPLNLVHRDVSPKNIRVTFSGSVKVIDFGIARAMNRATETAAGTIKGTLGYMSPEQILGDDIDCRSDIFAFGICLFQMLTCRNPFDGPTLKERVRRLTQAPVPSVREFNPALDDEIAGIVMRCLERDPNDRYSRMRDVQIELDRYLARLQVVSPRQRLIEFLELTFPSYNDEDTALKTALSEISSVAGRIDTAQRLRFPDDPPTETDRRAASSASAPLSGATAATDASQGPSERQTNASETAPDGYFTNDTRRMPNRPPVDPSTIPSEQTGATMVAGDDPSAEQRPPWMIMGLAGFALATVVAVVVSFWPVPTVQPLDVPKRTVLVEAPPDIVTPPPETVVKVPPESPPPESPPTTAPVTKTPVTKMPVRVPTRPLPVVANRQRAELFFRTARTMEAKGNTEDAILLYHLAYSGSGRRADPSIYLNLGLLYNKGHNVPKAKACLTAFLDRDPDNAVAPRVRTLVSSYDAVKTVKCVDRSQLKSARAQYQRRGAIIDGWVEETVAGRLK